MQKLQDQDKSTKLKDTLGKDTLQEMQQQSTKSSQEKIKIDK